MDTIHAHSVRHPLPTFVSVSLLALLGIVIVSVLGSVVFRHRPAVSVVPDGPVLEALRPAIEGQPIALVDASTNRVAVLPVSVPEIKQPSGAPVYRISEKPLPQAQPVLADGGGGVNAAPPADDASNACRGCGRITGITPVQPANIGPDEEANTDSLGYDVTVRYDDGREGMVHVEDAADWQVGERIRVQGGTPSAE